jgi:hypothetical protein
MKKHKAADAVGRIFNKAGTVEQKEQSKKNKQARYKSDAFLILKFISSHLYL